MRATGIVRRVDDLGRVVIPKEVRKVLDIREGDPLELFLDGDKLYFQRFIATEEFGSRVNRLIDLLKQEDFSVPNKDTVLSVLEIAKKLLSSTDLEGSDTE